MSTHRHWLATHIAAILASAVSSAAFDMSPARPSDPRSAMPADRRFQVGTRLKCMVIPTVLALLLGLAGCSALAAADAGGPAVAEPVSQVPSPPAPEPTATPTVAKGNEGAAPSSPAATVSRSFTPPPLMRPGFRTRTPGAASAEASRSRRDQCFAPGHLLRLDDSVQWSLDGSAVFFAHGRNVYAATVDGTDVHQLVDPAPRGFDASDSVGASRIGGMSAISVSPDGTQLLYSTCEYPVNYPTAMLSASPLTGSDYQYDIALVSTSGGEPRRLTNNDAYDNFPVWSPDGTRIAFLSARHRELEAQAFARPHLYTMAADGSKVRHPRARALGGCQSSAAVVARRAMAGVRGL